MTSNLLAPVRPNLPSSLPPQAHPGLTRAPSDYQKLRTASNPAPRIASDDDEPHPAKRRKVEDAGGSSSSPGQDGQQSTVESGGVYRWSRAETSQVHVVLLAEAAYPANSSRLPPRADNPPRPGRRKMSTKLSIRDARCPLRVRRDVPVPNTPDVLETPELGRTITKSCMTGFFPWTGKHPEDVLSEPNVKHGYSDRAPNPPEKEMNTAKIPLYNAFKTKLALDTLSSMYGLAVESRRQKESLPSSSNFKPPPRVTLTEAKRKSWLLDLANGGVPLRRLSRTIPQGIRGQTLLDQCLQHNVPISRAVWFTKCVGANEIRSLKRKGASTAFAVGAEAKWLKEWTVSVEQFVETTSQQREQPHWRTNVQYAIRLVTRLYYETLLDRDHFLDWLLKGLTAADVDGLPFWVMLAHIFTADLCRMRHTARRLATALMEGFQIIRTSPDQSSMRLGTKLKQMMRDLAVARPQSFLLPSRWQLCEEVLQNCLDLHNEDDQEALQLITTANRRLLHTQSSSASSKSLRQNLIHVLDSARSPYDIRRIYHACTDAIEDSAMRLITILEWCTTRFRSSKARVYLAARLLRLYHRTGLDVDAAFLGFMRRARVSTSTDPVSLKHLVLDLCRLRAISVSKYLQWLTVSGDPPASFHFDLNSAHQHVVDGHELDVVHVQLCEDSLQLLTEISLVHVEDHVVNWRNNMLARAGFDPDAERALIHHCKCFLAMSLSFCPDPPLDFRSDGDYSEPDFTRLPWSVKCDIAYWIRRQVRLWCMPNPASVSTQTTHAGAKLDMADFFVLRQVLEDMNDLAMLADVLRIASSLLREDMLAHITDVVHGHADVFSAIGALDNLQSRVCQAYVSLKSARSTLPLLAIALLGLNRHYPTPVISVGRLVKDIIEGSRDRPMAACSPFSDTIAESLQQAENFVEEFEAILQAETNMAEQTMTQLFSVLIERLHKRLHLPDAEQLQLFQLLARLRLSRVVQGSQLLSEWLEQQVLRQPMETVYDLIMHLVYTGTMDLAIVMETLDKLKNGNATQALRMRLLDHKAVQKNPCGEPAQYRWALELSRYLDSHSADRLALLAHRIREGSSHRQTKDDLLSVCAQPTILSGIPLDHIPSEISDRLAQVLDQTLHIGGGSSTPGNLDLAALVARVDDLSLPMCTVRARLFRRAQDASPPDDRIDIAQSLYEVATTSTWDESSSTVTGEPAWASLLSAFGSDVASSVMHKSMESFFGSLPLFLQAKPSHHVADLTDTRKYLSIATHALPAANVVEAATGSSPLIEKFSLVLKALNHTTSAGSATNLASPVTTTLSMDTLHHYIPLLLRMTCLQKTTVLDSDLPAKAAPNESIKILLLLTSIALHPALAHYDSESDEAGDLQSFMLDVAALLTDSLGEDHRLVCARVLGPDKLPDRRVQWLFGSCNSTGSAMAGNVGEALQVVKDGAGRVGEWKVRPWEVLEGVGEGWIGLGVFGAQKA